LVNAKHGSVGARAAAGLSHPLLRVSLAVIGIGARPSQQGRTGLR
jgi:hypothetical protein